MPLTEDLKRFIKRLQRSNDAAKKRWLVILTAASSLLVIILWVGYLKLAVVAVAVPSGGLAGDQPGFWGTLKNGFSAVRDKTTFGLANSYVYFSKKAQTKNQFTIRRSGQDFIYGDLEKLPTRPLP